MNKPNTLDNPFTLFFETGWSVEPSGCWEWNGWRDESTRRHGASGMGHGAVNLRRRRYAAHRLAYEWWTGPIPKGMVVRHKCDNPPCVNPAHLEAGTKGDNSRDMWDRGRGWQQSMTHFKCGHPVTEENTRVDRNKSHSYRRCLECDRARSREYMRRRRAAVTASSEPDSGIRDGRRPLPARGGPRTAA